MELHSLENLPHLSERVSALSVSAYDEGEAQPITDEALLGLPSLPALEALTLSFLTEVSAAGLKALAQRAPSLRELSLQRAEGLSKDLHALLTPFKSLEALELNGAPALTKAGLGKLSALKLKRLKLSRCEKLKGGGLAALAGFEALESLSVRGQSITGSDIRALAALPCLEILELHPGVEWKKFKRHDVKPGVFAALGAAPSLRCFDPGRALTEGEAEALAASPSLEQVVIYVRDLTQLKAVTALGASEKALIVLFEDVNLVDEALLAAIPEILPNTASIAISQGGVINRGKGVTPAGLARLGKLKQLRRLSLRGSWGFKNPDMAFIKGLTELESLDFIHLYKLSAGIMSTLAGLTKLRHLNLSGIKLSDAAPKRLAKLPLESLYIDAGKIGDKGLVAIAKIPTLRQLAFRYLVGDVTDAGLAALKALSNLEALNVSIREVTRAGFESLAALPALRRLQLHVNPNTQLEDAWLAPLASAPALEELGFSQSALGQLTDATLEHLAASPSLTRLDIPKRGYEGEFSSEAMEAFRVEGRVALTLTGNDLFYVEACPAPNSWLS